MEEAEGGHLRASYCKLQLLWKLGLAQSLGVYQLGQNVGGEAGEGRDRDREAEEGVADDDSCLGIF